MRSALKSTDAKTQLARHRVWAANQRLTGSSGRALQTKVASVKRTAESPKRATCDTVDNLVRGAENHSYVRSAQTVRVDENLSYPYATCLIGDVIQVAVWIRHLIVNGWRDCLIPQCQTCPNYLHCTACRESLSAHGLQ